MPRQLSEREQALARENARQGHAARLLVMGVVMLGLGVAGLVVDIVSEEIAAWIILAVRGGAAGLAVVGAFNVLRAIGKLTRRPRADVDSDRG